MDSHRHRALYGVWSARSSVMVKPIDVNDLANLSPAQKSSLFEALYMVIAIDHKLEPAELEAFDAEVGRIPWALDTAMFELIRDKARLRVKSSITRDCWIAWIKEIGSMLGSKSLREKIIRTQA